MCRIVRSFRLKCHCRRVLRRRIPMDSMEKLPVTDPDRTGQTWKNSEAEKLRQEEERRKEEEQRWSKLTSKDFKGNERVYEHKITLVSIVHVFSCQRGERRKRQHGNERKRLVGEKHRQERPDGDMCTIQHVCLRMEAFCLLGTFWSMVTS